MAAKIIPYIAQAILSPRVLNIKRKRFERKRIKQKQPHLLTVYLRINDAYSYVLIQVLNSLQMRFDIQYDFRTVLDLQSDMYPAPQLWQKNAFNDGQYLAQLYDLDFPKQAPNSTPERDAALTAQLLHWELQPGYLERALALFDAYWQGKQDSLQGMLDDNVANNTECYQQHLQANQAMLKDAGHYLSGNLHYGGEWYWGVDRLQYLEQRLNDLNICKHNTEKTVIFNQGQQHFCKRLSSAQVAEKLPQANSKPITMYCSIRSPYSYLAICRARQLAQHYNTPLVIKPVLPMVMRRMKVPKVKSTYIAKDTKREAIQHGIDFGRIADPLGAGVERCYAIYSYAESKGKANEYLESYARGVWAQGLDSFSDAGVKTITDRVGLDWNEVKPLLDKEDWKVWAQNNLSELYGQELWGVPSLVYGDSKVFGQDRIDCIEMAIVKDLIDG